MTPSGNEQAAKPARRATKHDADIARHQVEAAKVQVMLNGMQYVKGQSRKKRIKELRDRIEKLEQTLL